ncbi:phytanoyl-CoA dioxygenase family protein [Bradyrhizobium archetypum]|uniref:Phytanoyl-CoA dioxygenase family protein n=1 Tax=Bradyrhizobium archetypum TaxID=2721160 RepID=A0A7Y4M2U8_9BRAD|nr:phytanoyl-CoA dioxygenase family protein [Bradyrhizobium archetypum]NOJ47791.1 phytanoyl-CoA dioxygenase family protein [Bradyrhizobium archetypum]
MIRSYGINERVAANSDIDAAVESLSTLGYAIVEGGYSAGELSGFAQSFDAARLAAHSAAGGTEALARIDEHNTIRTPFAYDKNLLALARNPAILEICEQLIGGYQVLSQQNGVINPPAKTYNQGAWHRDLPYQHVVFSRPMAINALFCLDAFTIDNGATLVLPATHKQEKFPSDRFVEASAVQVCAPAGSYIVLDCMLYHSGAPNRSGTERRAVNQVYTSPIIRQQIDLPAFLGDDFTDDPGLRRLLGYEVTTPRSDAEYFAMRRAKLLT